MKLIIDGMFFRKALKYKIQTKKVKIKDAYPSQPIQVCNLGEKKSGHLGKMSELNKTIFILCVFSA